MQLVADNIYLDFLKNIYVLDVCFSISIFNFPFVIQFPALSAKHCYGRVKNCSYQFPVVSLFSLIVVCLLDNNH